MRGGRAGEGVGATAGWGCWGEQQPEGRVPRRTRPHLQIFDEVPLLIGRYLQEDACVAVPEASEDPSDFDKQVWESRKWVVDGRQQLKEDAE